MWEAEEVQANLKEFCDNADMRCLTFTGDVIKCVLGLPAASAKMKGKGVAFMKPKPAVLVAGKEAGALITTELDKDPLVHLEKVLEQIYVPLLANSKNQEGWGEVVSKEVSAPSPLAAPPLPCPLPFRPRPCHPPTHTFVA